MNRMMGRFFECEQRSMVPAFLLLCLLDSTLIVFVIASLVGGDDPQFLSVFSTSALLATLLLFVLVFIYTKTLDHARAHQDVQHQSRDTDRLTREFVTLAGDMNSVMQGPLEDVMSAVRGLRYEIGSPASNLGAIKRGSEAVYGIARSFGVLAQDRHETYMVRINLDELVRYAQIVCQNHFQGLGISVAFEADQEALEFMGASGRWLLLLVSLMQFMADQIYRAGGRQLLIKRRLQDGIWELVLSADGAAPADFPFDLRQKLKEESTRELLDQTSSCAHLYRHDQWGLKIGSFQLA